MEQLSKQPPDLLSSDATFFHETCEDDNRQYFSERISEASRENDEANSYNPGSFLDEIHAQILDELSKEIADELDAQLYDAIKQERARFDEGQDNSDAVEDESYSENGSLFCGDDNDHLSSPSYCFEADSSINRVYQQIQKLRVMAPSSNMYKITSPVEENPTERMGSANLIKCLLCEDSGQENVLGSDEIQAMLCSIYDDQM